MEATTLGRDYHDNNVYAYDVKNAIKHISEVISGRKGYYCMGCQREMQAKKGDKKSHHFAHDPKDVDNKGKCTYSDETYRHKLAKDVLQVIKQIKVPALYKYPPLGEEGTPIKLRDSGTIYAHSVEIELPFFEAEDGQVKWGRKVELGESENRYLLIQPDVAFFDAGNKPILLIEIVATHKVDTDKLSKIRRLGIDVVQITVPKDAPAEIQGLFYKSNRTKWLYNYEQEATPYIRVSQGDAEGILPLDEFQRKLLRTAESYECRTSQIAGLLRAIGKCMGSEQYRLADQTIRTEIQRVERNAEGATAKLRVVQAEHRATVAKQYQPEENVLAAETSKLEENERQTRARRSDLEGRYSRKKEAIRREQEQYKPDCQSEIDTVERELARLGSSGGTAAEREEEIVREESRMGQDFIRSQDAIADNTARERAEAERIAEKGANLDPYYRGLETRTQSEFSKLEEAERRDADTSEATLRAQYEQLNGDALAAIAARDSIRTSNCARRIKEILDGGRLLVTIQERIDSVRRLQKAKQLFDSRAYKDWV